MSEIILKVRWRTNTLSTKNAIPQIDVFIENGYTKEEMKMVNETRKIMGDNSIQLTATCVRIPVMGGHSESVNIEFENDFDLDDVKRNTVKGSREL